jgi:hypothetical protein
MPLWEIRPLPWRLCHALALQKPWTKFSKRSLPSVKVIQSGDTLTGIVKDQAQRQGVKLSASEEFQMGANFGV